ncbi:ActS/PrrB/RegB family redox-sensitive histidine kinase [Hwanghaeella sp.]|uniref:ActS/PrrB/RegB family redox-sensitive histidine kinase n=1 Tax=Hwanghaeella sp. TaxID=2605943 RepID=UPI003CCBE9B9
MDQTAEPASARLRPPKHLKPRQLARHASRARRLPGVQGRTLALIRWVAVIGQLATVWLVSGVLEFPLPVMECLIVIAALALSNLWLSARSGRSVRLTDYHAALLLGFDLFQVSALIYLTGGLTNPFAVLIAVPVTVAATILSRRTTVALTILALFCTTFVGFYFLPLPWQGTFSALPLTYVFGLWASLAVLILFTAGYVWSVADESRGRDAALAEAEAALARERHMSALGTLAAAAAHELGSPLNTIALVSSDLARDVPPDSPLREDVDLLKSQADRCRDILASLSRTPERRGGQPFDSLPLTNLAEEAARDHLPDGVTFKLTVDDASSGAEPVVMRSPEFLQGIGNYVQNAGQFAKSTVELSLYWSDEEVRLRVLDDGPGFAGWMIDSLGEPYLSTRAGKSGHMGLGIFIAQTLLDRIGAETAYSNVKTGGACVDVVWSRSELDVAQQDKNDKNRVN